MPRENELVIRINGKIKGYQDALKAATKETENLQQTFNTIAKTGAVAFAGFIGAITLSTAQFAEFDNDLRAVKTLLDETSFSAKTLDEGFQELSGEALAALTEFPVTLKAINKSLFDIVSAGVKAEGAIEVLGSTSRLAVAGITSAAVATNGVTSALNAYQLQAKESEAVAAKFFTAQKFGKTTIEELSSFFGVAASSAASYGVSLEELLAATAAATTGGIKTRTAFFSLVAALNNLATPTQDAIDESERLGIEFSSTAIRTKGLKKFLDELTQAQGFNKQSIEKLFGSVEAQKLIFSLTGAQADKFKQTLDALSDSQQLLTTFSRAYEEQSQSLKNQLIILQNNFQAIGILIGKSLAPLVVSVTGAFTEFLKLLQKSPALVEFISRSLVAGTVIAGLTTTVGLAGLAFLKLRAIMIASAAATKGMSFAVKTLVGSTALGLFVAFLPEIIKLLDNSLIPALGATAIALFKTRGAMLAATTSTNGLRIAVKGLIGSTGLGLLIAFLPEIIMLIEKFFGDSTKAAKVAASEQKIILLQQAKDEREIAQARLRGREEQEIEFIRRRQELRKRTIEAEKIQDQDVRRVKLLNLKLLQEQLEKEEKAFEEERRIARESAAENEKKERKKITDTKLQAVRDENERIKAALAGQEKEQIDFLKRRQDIRNKEREVEKEQDANRRTAGLENIRLLNKQLLKEETEFFAKRDELRAEQTEIEAAIQAELEALSAEKRQMLQQNELDDLKRTFETKAKIRSLAVKKELLEQRKENTLREAEEERFGKAVAATKAFFRKEEFSNAETAASHLAQLQRSENQTQKTIGKAAALVQIGIQTQRGAIAAYSALAGIPVVGPALGAAAAAALIAYGLERATKVQAAQAGGMVAGTGFGDRIPFLLEPGELIVPRQNFDEVLAAVADQRAVKREEEEGEAERESQEILIGIEDDAADFITIKQNEQRFLGISQET